MLTLRLYQREALDALYAYWQGGGGNGLLVLPTGAGKSLVLAALVREVLERYPGLRICVVTHVRELIEQDYKELLGFWPSAPAGINSAGLGRRDTRARILFCGIQSVHRRARQVGPFDLVIVDEAHLIPRTSDTSYTRFLSDLQDMTPDLRIVGLTATPYRLDSGRLDKGEGALFEGIVYDANVGDLIRDGFLSNLVTKATHTKLDTTGVQKRGGDFVPGQLEARINQDGITGSAVAEMASYGAERKAWIAFCCGVAHARAVRDAVRERGFTCETITGETPSAERASIIAAFRAGRIRCLTSVGVLSTGFNVPHVDLIALLRPTESAGLFVQQVGRGLRLAPGKDNALVLDFAGNTRRHGPIDAIVVKQPGKGDGPAPVKTCPGCESIVSAAARECPVCGFAFEGPSLPRHDAQADAVSTILSRDAPPWLPVRDWSFTRHRKPGSPDSLRVEFRCGLRLYSAWVCLEHQGYARAKAREWWHARGGGASPETVSEALDRTDELSMPAEIRVRQNGKFPEIVGYRRTLAVAAA